MGHRGSVAQTLAQIAGRGHACSTHLPPSTYLSGEFLPIACQCRGVSYGSELSEGLGLPLGVLWADGAKIHGCKHHSSPTGQVLRHGPWGPKGSLPHHPALDS